MTLLSRSAVFAVGLSWLVTSVIGGAPQHFPVSDVRPGMVATGETVFSGTEREPFTARIIGVLENVTGPRRRMILARLEGGPLQQTGVIAGMSGSPVYIDGRLLGAVAYSLGQFSKEPIAGITPIGEMIEMAAAPGTSPSPPSTLPAADPVDEASLVADLQAPPLWTTPLPRAWPTCACCPVRPESRLPPSAGSRPPSRSAGSPSPPSAPRPGPRRCRVASRHRRWRRDRADARRPARGGDAVGVNLVAGDLAIAATGTVTAVDGHRSTRSDTRS